MAIAALWGLSVAMPAYAQSSAIDQYSESIPKADGKEDRNSNAGSPAAADDGAGGAGSPTVAGAVAPAVESAENRAADRAADRNRSGRPDGRENDRSPSTTAALDRPGRNGERSASGGGLSVGALAALMLGSLVAAGALGAWSRRTRRERANA